MGPQGAGLKIGQIVHYRNGRTRACVPGMVVEVTDVRFEQAIIALFGISAPGTEAVAPRARPNDAFQQGTWHWATDCPDGL